MRYANRIKILNITICLSAVLLLACLFLSLFGDPFHRGKLVYINEVCSSNIHAYKDENEEHPDYIEIYNGEDRDVDLSGWKLSDNRKNENPWVFPEVVLPSHGFLVINADNTVRRVYPEEQKFGLRNFLMTGKGYVPEDTGLHASLILPSKGSELFLSDAHNKLIDSVEIPELKYDTVYGRVTDGAASFDRLTPSPGESNEGCETVVFPSLKIPVFSADSGFYDSEFELGMTSPDGGEIRYTLDGSDPDKDSLLYSGPIRISDASENENVYSVIRNTSVYLYDYYDKKDFHIPLEKVDKCSIVRAKVFSADGKESDTVTKSYFVGFDDKKMYEGHEIISLVSDPENLFDSKKGIYVLGDIGLQYLKKRYEKSEEAKALLEADPTLPLDGSVKIADIGYTRNTDGNYMQHGIDWEREADITLFSDDHASVKMQQAVGIRVKGNSSRQYPAKGFNLYARNAYSGKDVFNASFFDEDKKTGRVTLSAGGNDRFTMTRDSFVSERIEDTGLDVASGKFGKTVYLFLNGEFWGAYVIAERLDEEFFSEKYGVEADNVIFIKEGEVEAGRPDDIHYYYVFLSLYEDKDFSDEEEYGEFCEAVDIDSLLDYYSLRIFAEYGMDWPHTNYGFWRVREPDGNSPYGDCKWRFVNFDNNVSLDYEKVDTDMMDVMYNGSEYFGKDELFTSLMENPGFKKAFEKRFKEVAEKVYMSDEAVNCYKRIAEEMEIPVSESYGRWYSGHSGYNLDFYRNECDKVLLFLKERYGHMEKNVEKACE